jgi:hypothetical protein
MLRSLWSESEWKKKAIDIAKAVFEVLCFLKASFYVIDQHPLGQLIEFVDYRFPEWANSVPVVNTFNPCFLEDPTDLIISYPKLCSHCSVAQSGRGIRPDQIFGHVVCQAGACCYWFHVVLNPAAR